MVSGTLLTVRNRIEKMSLINSRNNNKKEVTGKTDLKKLRALEQLYVCLHQGINIIAKDKSIHRDDLKRSVASLG